MNSLTRFVLTSGVVQNSEPAPQPGGDEYLNLYYYGDDPYDLSNTVTWQGSAPNKWFQADFTFPNENIVSGDYVTLYFSDKDYSDSIKNLVDNITFELANSDIPSGVMFNEDISVYWVSQQYELAIDFGTVEWGSIEAKEMYLMYEVSCGDKYIGDIMLTIPVGRTA